MSSALPVVHPLGLFGLSWPIDNEPVRSELLPLVGMLPEAQRAAIGTYLRAGTIIFALMECTTDVLGAFPAARREKLHEGAHILEVFGGAFAVPGGSGILTDGTYYWRLDAADYVEHYGVGLPDEFLRHGRALGWVPPPPLKQQDVISLYDHLLKHMGRLPGRAEKE